MTAAQQWYIDAWSVIDGYAFASARPPDSLEAVATFFVCPPYFEPEPVASLATALAATRGHFQEGYRIEGAEVPFDSAEQVVEAVRRAYRAGGLDIDGSPMPGAPPPAPVYPGAVDPESLVDREMSDVWHVLRPLLRRQPSRESLQEFEELLALLIESMFPKLVHKFVGYAAFDMLRAIEQQRADRGEAARALGAWMDRAAAIGIHVQLRPSLIVGLRGTSIGYEWPALELGQMSDELLESLAPILYRTSGDVLSEFSVPFVVPIPSRFQALDFPPVPTLGHLLAVVSSDPRYLSSIDSVVELVPVVVAALIQLPPRSLPFSGFPPIPGSPELRRMSAVAARSLAGALPSDRLHGHVVEDTIHKLVLRLLTRTPDSRSDLGALAV